MSRRGVQPLLLDNRHEPVDLLAGTPAVDVTALILDLELVAPDRVDAVQKQMPAHPRQHHVADDRLARQRRDPHLLAVANQRFHRVPAGSELDTLAALHRGRDVGQSHLPV
jgi:hypothetical protein